MDKIKLFMLSTAVLLGSQVSAELKIHSVFQHNMVLQKDQPVKIFGTSDPGSRVKVSFNGKNATVKTDDKGFWVAELRKMRETKKATSIYISAKQRTGMAERKIDRVHVGDVWLIVGGSNVDYDFTKHNTLKAKYKEFENEDIRGFGFSKNPMAEPYNEVKIDYKFRHEWRPLKEEYAEAMSPLALYFGTKVNEYLDCPVGVIKCAYPKSRIESWIPAKDLEEAGINAIESKKGDDKVDHKHSSSLFNGMIHPLKNLSIAGVVYYPGEADLRDPVGYEKKFKTLITSWRKFFENEELPFLVVQPQSMARPAWNTSGEALAWFRESQAKALELPNVYLTPTTDLGQESSFLAEEKKEIGERLALHVLKMKRSKTISSGPSFKRLNPRGYKIVIDFENADSGLMAKRVFIPKKINSVEDKKEDEKQEDKKEDDKKEEMQKPAEKASTEGTVLPEDKIVGFEICGRDGVFHPAEVKIMGRSVEIFSRKVRRPAAIRYGWKSLAPGNLFNEEGLPVLPFRTDNLPAPGFEGELESKAVTITSIVGKPLEPLMKVSSYTLEKSKVAEVEALKTVTPKGKDYYAFFKNVNTDIKDGKKPKLKIMVVFYDEGDEVIEITYDSNDQKTVVSKNKPGMYKSAGKIKMTNTKTWRYVEVDVPDGLFSSRLGGGSDIRLKSKSEFHVSGVFIQPL